MSSNIYPGRYTAEIDDSFVIFLVGSHVESLRHLMRARWLGQAMNEMLDALSANPQKGFLGGETFYRFWPFTSILVSYWRSYEDLERFAHDKSDPHLEPWRRFNREIGSDGRIGIWHETYVVQAGQYETMYGNMPVFGLAKASRHVPVTRRLDTARQRLNRTTEGLSTPL